MSASVEEGPTPSRRADPFLAGLFSLLWAGIGQLYAGNWRKALFFVIAAPVVTALARILIVTIPVTRANLLPILMPLGLQLAAIVDAFREARRPQMDGGRAWYGRWYVCAALILFGVVLWFPFQLAVLRTSVVQAFHIPTGGMETTVQIGDYVYASNFAYGLRHPFTDALLWHRRDPRRGDVIVFRYPEDRSRDFIKRVIGLPGETVEIRDRQVIVDGQVIREPYVRFLADAPDLKGRRSWGPMTVPAGHLFVLGDNRDNNRDSRHWGFLPMDDVRGKARVVYFSIGEPRRNWVRRLFAIRWGRLGTILQ